MGYKEKQVEWLKMNGLREGSRVYVYRKAENYEDGWRYWWIDCLMDEEVGKVANIMEIHPCSLKVKVGDKTFYMPYTAMLPVGVTEFEVGRRYKYVGPKSAEYFIYLNIEPRDATLVTSGAELMVEKFENDRVKFTTTNHSWHFKGNWNDFVAIPEKDYYKELDRWITTNDLKVGDKVRILRSPTLEDMEGWERDWYDRLDKYVGQVGIVDFYYGDNDIIATFPDGEEVFVPYAVLEKVERSVHGILVDVHTSLDAMGIKVLSVELNDDNHITIEGVIR